ncbi:MAG: isochorismatase family protein [Hyphomicrobiaceae bacterium]|nr:isochorismatase family protein [Hyphomicrobiaceae bacterium]
MPPLLKPAESILLILDPRPEHLERIDSTSRGATTHKLTTAHRAAQLAGVPTHLAGNGTLEPAKTWNVLAAPIIAANTHDLPPTSIQWRESPLGLAIAASDRNSLVLCGFWLECTATFTALAANAEGIDVAVLLDATPHFLTETKQPAIDRLTQAGVVPMTTAQMIMEWAEGSASSATKQQLMSLLSEF